VGGPPKGVRLGGSRERLEAYEKGNSSISEAEGLKKERKTKNRITSRGKFKESQGNHSGKRSTIS